MDIALERKRTAFDIILGILLVLAGAYVLANAVVATSFLVFVIAWTALISGVLLLISSLWAIRSTGLAWPTLIGGAILTVLGIFMLRNTVIGAVALTLIAGALFFVSGLIRVGLATTLQKHKAIHIISGLISVALGLWIVFNPMTATLSLLGILLGVQVVVEGLTLLITGRLRVVRVQNEDALTPQA